MRLLLFCCFLNCSFVFSQEKIEREYRIHPTQVPQKARDFINKIQFDTKLKWYAEENQNGEAFELKSYKNKRKFSIKFLPSGELVDVEKKLRAEELPALHQQKINKALEKKFRQYKITKIQIRWEKNNPELFQHIENKQTNFNNAVYEIIVNGKEKKTYRRYEILINFQGEILYRIPLSKNNNDNLEF